MAETESKFGDLVRRERNKREIGLRRFAAWVGISPTYLSKIERNEFTPPFNIALTFRTP